MIISLRRVSMEPNYPPESTGCRTHANRVSAMQDCSPAPAVPAPHAAVSQGLLQCTKEEPFPGRQCCWRHFTFWRHLSWEDRLWPPTALSLGPPSDRLFSFPGILLTRYTQLRSWNVRTPPVYWWSWLIRVISTAIFVSRNPQDFHIVAISVKQLKVISLESILNSVAWMPLCVDIRMCMHIDNFCRTISTY